jgi:hypothetical protein
LWLLKCVEKRLCGLAVGEMVDEAMPIPFPLLDSDTSFWVKTVVPWLRINTIFPSQRFAEQSSPKCSVDCHSSHDPFLTENCVELKLLFQHPV